MKRFLLFFCFLQIGFCYAQFSDDFNDGLFHHDEENYRLVNWEGDTAHFKVNQEFQLQLNAPPKNGSSQLRTHSSRVRNTSWEFYVNLKFTPSVNNYGKIFLISDREDLNEKLNGLYVRVGYTDRNICLVGAHKDKSYELLIEGEKNRLSGSKNELLIRVTIDESGTVELYSRKFDEESFVLEGTILLSSIPSGKYVGILCIYTQSRNKSFYFDDFVVKKLDESIEDTDEPDPEDPTNPQEPEPEEPEEPENPEEETIIQSLLFSEIMAHPNSGSAEYVEIYNPSDETIFLSDYLFYYGDKSYKLPEEEIEAKSYFVLCKENAVDSFSSKVKAIGVKSFPTLANTGKLLMLTDLNGNLITWFEYSNTMYNDSNKKNGGWSLECVDLNNISNTSENWTASENSSGGTPGRENSVKATNKDTTLPQISSFSFDQDRLILYFSKPMNRKLLLTQSLYSFSDTDYMVKELKTNYPQGTELIMDLNQNLDQEEYIELYLNGLTDLTGNPLENNTLSLGYVSEVEEYDLLINEILFDPNIGGDEYIEIYNPSDKTIDLRFVSIATRKSTDNSLNKLYVLATSSELIYPKEYLLLTRNINGVCGYYTCLPDGFVVEMSALPSMNNTSGCIVLMNNQDNEIIDEFYYDKNMHTSQLKSKKGISLERITWDKPTNDRDNWQSALEEFDFGTPGYENSKKENVTKIDSILSVEYPDSTDEYYRFTYELSSSDYTGSLMIFDSYGRLIHSFKEYENLKKKETIRWNRNSFSLHAGICILFIEAYNSSGKLVKEKIPFVVK